MQQVCFGRGHQLYGLAIAAAYNCGIRNFDVALGYEAARKNELGSEGRPAGAGKLDVGQFVERGYSPYSTELHMQTTPRGSGFSASHTLEYSFSAYAVAQMPASWDMKPITNGFRSSPKGGNCSSTLKPN